MGPKLRTRMAIFVATLWAVSYVVAAVQTNYTGVSLTTPVMLVVAAYLFASHRNGNGNGTRH